MVGFLTRQYLVHQCPVCMESEVKWFFNNNFSVVVFYMLDYKTRPMSTVLACDNYPMLAITKLHAVIIHVLTQMSRRLILV